MRKIELILGMILAGLFFYCFMEVMGTLVSGFLGLVTPMWDAGKYFNTNDAKRIRAFESSYKVSYIFMFMGYLGLTLCYASEGGTISLLVLGIIFLIPFLCYMFILPFFQNNYERVKRH